MGTDERVVRHGGANDFGFAARRRWYVEEDLLLVLLLNREPPGMDVSIAADAVEQVLDGVARKEVLDPPPDVAALPGSDDLDRYVGRYSLVGGDEVVVRTALGSLVVQPCGPVSMRHLAFHGASSAEREAVSRLDRQAIEMLDGMSRRDYEPLRRAVADPSRFAAFRDYIAGWWQEFEEAGGTRDHVEVLGTVPIWWTLEDTRLATVIAATVENRSTVFRLHWRDGLLAGLGGGAIREPATTLFAPTGSDAFVGYHLGIRSPVWLSFDANASGEITGLRFHTPEWTLPGWRVRNGLDGPKGVGSEKE